MNRPKQNPATLWKAIQDSELQDDVDEILAMSDAELDAYLTAHGGDPAKLRADGEALAKELDARHDRLAWHGEMDKKLDDFRAVVATTRAAPRPKLSRDELLARLKSARADARFAAPVAALFRDKTPEASTDEELLALLDQIELLAKLEEKDRSSLVSKVKPLLPGPVAEARRILRECDVRHPRDIRVDAMAARYGAMVVYGPLSTAAGSIVRTRDHAIICVDERARGTPRGDFTTGHELAHHRLHDVVDHFAQCDGERSTRAEGSREARRAAREAAGRKHLVEKEANHFTAELSMPEEWAAPLCDVASPTLDDVYRLTRTFPASFHASAIRFIELAPAPCAFVHTVGGLIKRSTETASFPGAIVQGRAVDPRSIAAPLQDRVSRGVEEHPREVPGAAWGDEGGRGFVEHAIALGPELGVMSWIVAAG